MEVVNDNQESNTVPGGLAFLRSHLSDLCKLLKKFESERFDLKPVAVGWSPEEELGHLIDSACNNHQRILRVQLQDGLDLGSGLV